MPSDPGDRAKRGNRNDFYPSIAKERQFSSMRDQMKINQRKLGDEMLSKRRRNYSLILLFFIFIPIFVTLAILWKFGLLH
jgi:hypothetical protein